MIEVATDWVENAAAKVAGTAGLQGSVPVLQLTLALTGSSRLGFNVLLKIRSVIARGSTAFSAKTALSRPATFFAKL